MKADTHYRIEAYQQALPYMREKVAAALLMLVIAAVVAVTATYAWVTLSLSPAVSGMATTLAANGSLEIALAKEDGSAPDEFDLDESVSINTDEVTVSNLQWGNLVNLSDPSYGISDIALRPARLNTASLLGNPLWGAVYSADGRVTSLNTDYAYVKYNAQKKEYRVDNAYYGVRAIASYKAEIADSTMAAQQEKLADVAATHQAVNDAYLKVRDAFTPLGSMVSAYAQEVVDEKLSGSATPADLGSYLNAALGCYQAVYDAMLLQREAYVALANYQSYMAMQNANMADQFVPVTWEELSAAPANFNSTDGTASKNGTIKLMGLTQFIKDMGTMKTDIETLTTYYKDWQTNGTPYYWGSKGEGAPAGRTISAMVSDLIEWSTMTVDLEDNGNEVKVLSLNTDMLGQIIAANNKERKVYVYGGVMRRFEQTAVDDAYRINGEASCTIKIKALGVSITVKGKAYTKASGASTFMENYSVAVGSSSLAANDALAEDTYGLVVDLWLRTNAEETYLTLEGAIATDEDGSIMSYDGVNRVWGATGNAQLTTNSTTQGGGSCYVYYADTPEDMARSLSLLEAMKVAFVDSNGTLLATADMDTGNYYAVNGRVTVPLVLSSKTELTYTYTDDKNGEQTGRAITAMYADRAIRVTAIIYLDGDLLTNDDVLAESEIQGRLNLQFGSSQKLDTVGSKELLDDARTVTAEVDKTELDFDTANSVAEKTVTITAEVKGEGDAPTSVTAYFLRAINSTQGSREEKMIFTQQQDGTWTADHTFDSPGTYYLRYITLDGVEYTLDEPLKVTVKGFALDSVTWTENEDSVTFRTSDSTHSTGVTVAFASDSSRKQPSKVEARFVRQDGNTVNVPLRRGSQGTWTGSVTFTTSGVYTLQYLLLDGQYRDLADGGYAKTIDLSLGMYVSVRNIKGVLSETFIAKDEQGNEILYDRSVAVKIYDNTGAVLDVDVLGEEVTPILYYSYGSSATATVDADLTWNESTGEYEGTFALNKAGRYRFLYVDLEGSSLTRCTDSPVYTLISPEPPVYDTSSACGQNDEDGIQYVPLTANAKIDNIRIGHAEAALVQVVVYNEIYDQFQTVETTVASEGVLYIALPTYQLPTGETDSEGDPVLGPASQEGQWHVAAILLSECYDADGGYHAPEESPIVWVDSGAVGTEYLARNEMVSADERYDFSALSTNVSSQVNVQMEAGKTALGGKDTAFGKVWYTSDIGMSVTLTDGAGRVIPSGKVGSVKLSVTYDQTNAASYGYAVNTGSNTYDIDLAYDREKGAYTVKSEGAARWVYVGEYNVNSLSVTVGGQTLTVSPGSSGVPTRYTVTSAAPTGADIQVEKNKNGQAVTQNTTVFGKTGGNITGTFLQSHDLNGTYVVLSMEDSEGKAMSGVSLTGVDVSLELTHTGKSAANGGYTFPGSTYQTVSVPMTQGQNSSSYNAGSHILLAGEYTGSVKLTMGGTTQTYELDNKIEVYSKKPTLKVTGVDPDTSKTVQINTYTGTSPYLYSNAVLTTVQNYKSDYVANVYIAASKVEDSTSGKELVDYTLPKVKLTLSDCGNFDSASANLNGNTQGFQFTSGNTTATAEIGTITEGTFVYDHDWLDRDKTSKYEIATALGEQNISQITVVKGQDSYVVSLEQKVVIRQKNAVPPSISFTAPEGYEDVSRLNQVSQDGEPLQVTLPSSIGTVPFNYQKSDESAPWVKNDGLSTVEYLVYYEVGELETVHNHTGIGSYKYTSTVPFTYYCYTRTTFVEEKTSVFQTYKGTYGILKWKIGSQEYAPGTTITVTGDWHAEAVVGLVDEGIAVGDPVEKMVRRYTRTESDPSVVAKTGTAEVKYNGAFSGGNEEKKKEAENAALAKYNELKPEGYTWFNGADPTQYVEWGLPSYEEVEIING